MENWDNLRIFLSVTRNGSIRAAAKALGITHATVSRRSKVLEDVLGNPLFERKREGQCLTQLGQRILPLAESIEERFAEIDRLAFSADTGLAGTIRLSLCESLYSALLHTHIHDFMRRYPKIELDLIATKSLINLAQREADVVIRITRNPPETAYGRKMADSPLGLYASNAYLANRPIGDRWISLDYAPARKPVLPAKVVARASSPNLAAQLIRSGRGMGLLPCYLGDTDPELERVPDVELIPDMQIWVLTHEDIKINPRVRALMDHLYQVFKDCRPIIEGEKFRIRPKTIPRAEMSVL
jgi:molybdate transport repressor ModE-like protein